MPGKTYSESGDRSPGPDKRVAGLLPPGQPDQRFHGRRPACRRQQPAHLFTEKFFEERATKSPATGYQQPGRSTSEAGDAPTPADTFAAGPNLDEALLAGRQAAATSQPDSMCSGESRTTARGAASSSGP
jgi:hypothetical protein